jgi:hypothetical protein
MPLSSTQGNRFKETHFSPRQCSVVVVGYDFPSPHFIYLCFNKFGKLRDKVIYVEKKKKIKRNYCFICVESYRRLKDLDLQIKKKKEKGKRKKEKIENH